jgi:hypothetical protein
VPLSLTGMQPLSWPPMPSPRTSPAPTQAAARATPIVGPIARSHRLEPCSAQPGLGKSG